MDYVRLLLVKIFLIYDKSPCFKFGLMLNMSAKRYSLGR